MGKNFTMEEQVTIRYLRDKLDWYVHEASDLEYDHEEVTAMLNLLKLIDPPRFEEDDFSPEKAFERFWETQELRKQIHEEMERMKRHGLRIVEFPNKEHMETGDVEEPEPAPEPKKPFRHRKMSAVITAAALVIVISLSVTAGVYAERMGYFYKIQDDTNNLGIISVDQDAEDIQYNRYDSLDEIPIPYTRYIWIPNNVPEDMELKFIDINDDSMTIKVDARYQCKDSNEFIVFTKKSINQPNVYYDQPIDSFTIIDTKRIEDKDMDIKYMSKDNSDYNEFVITFNYKNSIYLIASNLDFAVVRNVADSYIESLK